MLRRKEPGKMFKNISIEGFRGIKHLQIDDFRQINLFVGENNCCKTSILECLFFLTAPTNISLPAVRVNAFRGFTEVHENSWKILFNKLAINTDIEISTETSKPLERRHLLIKVDKELTSEPVVIDKDKAGNYSGMAPVIDGLILEYSLRKKTGGKPKKYIAKVYKNKEELQYSFPPDYKDIANGVFIRPENNYNDIYTLLDSIQRKKRLHGIIKILQQIEPSLVDLSLGAWGIINCDIGLQELIPVNIMGNGITRILSIISTISEMSNGIVLIDEIENGFYYTSQKILWEAIFTAAKEFNVQVFATTHSMDCIRALSNAYTDRDNDKIRLYRVERNDDDFKVISYDHNVLRASLESDWEVR